jgi:hypothetical protein
MPHATSATVVARPREDPTMLAAEQVAGVVAGIPTPGEACDALTKAGWRASIAGNRITVNDEVFTQFIRATVGSPGGVKGLSSLRGPFGVLDSDRIDVKRDQFRGHLLDRQMLELIRAG